MHCTHAYFGTLSQWDVDTIVEKVDAFFKANAPISMPRVVFDQVETFDDDTRVLVTRNLGAFQALNSLRLHFAELGMISTKYSFRPHVSTSIFDSVAHPFYSYALMKSGHVLRQWEIECEETQVSNR